MKVWTFLEKVSIGWLNDFFNKVIAERKMPDDWRSNSVYPYMKAREMWKL